MNTEGIVSISAIGSASSQWLDVQQTGKNKRPDGPPPGPPPGGGGPIDTVELSSNALKMLDQDGDGSIDIASELGDEGPDALIKLADTDGDGKVTQAELQAQTESFDTDGDGKVSREEMDAAFDAAGIDRSQGPPPGPPPGGGSSSDSSSSDSSTSQLDQLRALLEQLLAKTESAA